MNETKPAYRNPLIWVSSSYLAMGLIYVTVGSVANIMFKNMGMENDKAALWSSILGFPYTLKFLWAPVLELYKTKKYFVVLMQFLLAISVAGVGLCLKFPAVGWPVGVLALLTVAGLLGATQDIGSDGVYVTTLPPTEMAKYTGLQGMVWNAGFLLASGPLIYLTGKLYEANQNWGAAWSVVMFVIAGIMVLAAFYHLKFLPAGAKALDAPRNVGEAWHTFSHAFKTFFQKRDVFRLIAFAFLFRSAYGLIDKMGPLFMIDDRANGGLGFNNQMLGEINGTYGTAAFILGSLLGGLYVARKGLKKTLLILCLCLNVPNVTFLILSQTLPTNQYVITALVTVEKFGWGIGCVGQMIYMMQQIAPGPYRTTHYTYATALMGASMMLTGAVSGYIQRAVGYQWFFIIVLLAAIPSILVTLLAPFHHPGSGGPEEAEAIKQAERDATAPV
jgi:PAT family beta-lactamase induction signal transducer AmpG